MPTPDPNPRPQCPHQRHLLLFELIRQRSMAQYVSQKRSAAPDVNPADLHLFAQTANRSIAPENPARPLL